MRIHMTSFLLRNMIIRVFTVGFYLVTKPTIVQKKNISAHSRYDLPKEIIIHDMKIDFISIGIIMNGHRLGNRITHAK